MAVDRIIALTAAADDLFDENNPRPSPSALIAEYNDGVDKRAYLTITDLVDWPGSAYIVGAWDRDQSNENGYLQFGESFDAQGDVQGTPLYPIQSDLNQYIMPLGNDAGRATGIIDCLKWQGAPSGKYQLDDTRYPTSDSPFTLEIIRQDYGSDAQAWDNGTTYNTGDFATSGGMWMSLQDNNTGNTPFGGSPFWEFINQSGPWGWVVKMLSDDPLRDITARAVGLYTDPECTIFEFTTGAFINDGKYGDVFYTECPPGNRDTVREQINFALLLGAAQEGFFNLPDSGEDTDALFWSHDQ